MYNLNNDKAYFECTLARMYMHVYSHAGHVPESHDVRRNQTARIPIPEIRKLE